MEVVTNFNIKQVTGYDIPNNFTSEEVTDYVTILENVNILKLGYCCEPKGIDYPILLQMNGAYHEIKVGKNCMYEMQPETWKNVNKTDSKEKVTDVIITGVRVPRNIIFTLNYVVSIN